MSKQNEKLTRKPKPELDITSFEKLQDEIQELRLELECHRTKVEELQRQVEMYETLLEDKDAYISEIQREVAKAQATLEKDYARYEDIIKEHTAVEQKLMCDVQTLKTRIYIRTMVTITLVSLLVLISMV